MLLSALISLGLAVAPSVLAFDPNPSDLSVGDPAGRVVVQPSTVSQVSNGPGGMGVLGAVQEGEGSQDRASTDGASAGQGAPTSASEAETTSPQDSSGDLIVPSEHHKIAIRIPKKERLAFVVQLNMAIIGRMQVGSFVMTSRTEAYRSGLPKPGETPSQAPKKRKGFIRAQARGGYMGYTLKHSIDARILPQKWPRVIVRDYQTGSENRRREVMYGERQGKAMSWYRRDRHCRTCDRREHFVKGRIFSDEHHCKGCKRGEHRDWDAPKMQQVPPGALDMISAIFLARELVRTQGGRVQFPLLDKDGWWDMTMVLGERANIETPAGTFACQAVKLDPQPPKGKESKKEFKGLFGIHGTLSIWLHEKTGVPVKIEGIVPVGPLDLDVAIVLAQYSDTAATFLPVGATSAVQTR